MMDYNCYMTSMWILWLVTLLPVITWAALIEKYVIPEVDQCSSHFRDISGAIVASSPAIPLKYQDQPCYLKFSADGTIMTRKRMMIKFSKLQISDCRVRLRIYDGRSQLSLLSHDFSCNASAPSSITESTSNFFTLSLDMNGAPGYSVNFQMHITAFESKRSGQLCPDFPCSNGFCINKDLICDGYDSCLDGSDETNNKPAQCKPVDDSNSGTNSDGVSLKTGSIGSGVKKVYKKMKKWVIGLIVVIAIILLVILILCLICCLKKKSHHHRQNSPPSPSGGPSTTMTTTAYHAAPSAPPDGSPNGNGDSQSVPASHNGIISDKETIKFLP